MPRHCGVRRCQTCGPASGAGSARFGKKLLARARKDSVRRRTCGHRMRSLVSHGSGSIREAIGMSPCTDELKLVALEKDDIEVISAHVQDSLVKIADILWRPSEHRFVIALDRFDWMSAAGQAGLPALPDRAALRTRACLQMPQSRSNREGRAA